MKTISRYIMTLALLLTAVTGAWADIAVGDVFKTGSTIDFGTTSVRYKTYSGSSDNSTLGATGKQTLTYQQYTNGKHWFNISTGSGGQSIYIVSDNTAEPWGIKVSGGEGTMGNPYSFEVLFEAPFFDLPLVSQPGAKPQLWEFEMPAFDVVLTPIYAKAAAFATTGTEPEVKTLLPEAAEGVIAGTDAPLIKEGTGIVAFAGTSTTVTQGTLMYAIGTSATQAPALTAFSATVPTAKNVADDGADVYVWYYIKGADAPDGQQATEDNTFNDTEPACLTVTVLTNKFDIQFNAANANTIETGKATVTVDGTAATVTDGKLQGVKMGTEVKLKANTGYKFRKVEVKKKEALIVNPEVGQVIGSDGKNYAANATLPDGVTKVAMIAYVDGSNGLAIALADEGSKNWATAISTCEAKTPAVTNGTWKLPTRDEWKQMFGANGGNDGNYNGLNNALAAAGGDSSKLEGYAWYWSSSQYDGEAAYGMFLNGGSAGWFDVEKGESYRVRACLAF